MDGLSFKEIQAKISELEVLAKEARTKELANAKTEIWKIMDAFGLTARDLERGRQQHTKARSKVAPKYQDPVSGQQWTGRGRAPKWLEGKDKSDFLIPQ